MTEEPILLSLRFSEALRGAADLHATQFKKGTTIPYIAHLLGVASIALHHGADEDEAIGALLHDTIEDAPPELGANWVRNWLRFRFSERVLDIVEGCTDADISPKPPWRARKEDYVARVPKEPASVVLVSASDKLHNASSILADYREIKDALWARFNRTAGKAGTIGYYRGLVTAYRTNWASSQACARAERRGDADRTRNRSYGRLATPTVAVSCTLRLNSTAACSSRICVHESSGPSERHPHAIRITMTAIEYAHPSSIRETCSTTFRIARIEDEAHINRLLSERTGGVDY